MTDPIALLDQARQGLITQFAGLQKQLTDQAATIAARDARIADLEAQLNPTPPKATGPAWGTNIGTNTGKLAQVDKAMGGIDSARFYLSPGKGIHFPTAAELGGDLGSRILVMSAKLKPQDVLAKKYDAQIQATADACPTDRPTLLCDWHEPGSEVYAARPVFSAAQFRDAQARFAELVHGVGNPMALVALIEEGFTWNGHAGRNWRDFYAGSGTADVFCTDEYAWGPGNPKDLSTIFAGCKAAADEAGVPCSVTETGADPATFGTGQALLDAITTLAKRAKAVSNGPVAMSFGSMPGDRWDMTSDPKRLAAWKAGQVG